LIKLDFPEPETPVIDVRFQAGIDTSIFFKLLCVAQIIVKNLSFFLFFLSIITFFAHDKYGQVTEFGFFIISSKVHSAIISQP
jgi:hypothetical protein